MHEEEIVWLEDVSELDYVRETGAILKGRKRPPRKNVVMGRVVGYSTVNEKSESKWYGCFYRRIFYLAPHDRDSQPEGIYKFWAPTEAVDPRTVAPGVDGRVTETVIRKP